jgi:hypothetical protein
MLQRVGKHKKEVMMSDQIPGTYAPIPAALPLPTSGLAIGSLIASIVSWVLMPIIGSVVGLVLGYAARKDTRAVPPTASGDGLATAGIIISWINIGVVTCACLTIFVLMVLGPVIGSTFSSINSSLQSP